ncbi:Caspase domain protein [Planctomycetes bacterium CA13]|uniref:Caspase domain protein n=1 Tax=Novipirellula herctigrandis TaxID=2527986 RepID=A0A5C5YZU2_9BACT|nr:Caspase domain protein [Planctomycetes bacterium CA13]
MKKKSTSRGAKQSALIVGVGNYAPEVGKLPAVANDVRAMGDLLASRKGMFTKATTKVLLNSQAKRGSVLNQLKSLFQNAPAEGTVFAYLAGHGMVLGNEYFYLPYDYDRSQPKLSSVPLAELKAMFDATTANRAFLWLDCCHAGGVLRRRSGPDETTIINRTLKAVKGTGKVIVAACKPDQSAYEDSGIGHGLFTDALVRGLRGEAKTTSGEVTAGSLYDFIDQCVTHPSQQPMFFGEQTGRIVLMNHGPRKAASGASSKPSKASKSSKKNPTAVRAKGTWVMLGEDFHLASKVRSHSDGSIDLTLTPHSPESEARIVSLKPRGFSHRGKIRYAADKDACDVEVLEVVNEIERGKPCYTVRLKSGEQTTNQMMEMSVQGLSPDEIAQRRIGRLLFNDPPSTSSSGYGEEQFIENAISGSFSDVKIDGSVIQEIYRLHGESSDWRSFARLKAISMMKASCAIEHVLELTIGPVRASRVKVSFRGVRPQRYANQEPTSIRLDGYCRLE